MKQLMTGNEAIARGAWEAGVTFASAYPGTPSTEILENIVNYPDIQAEWAPNEKVALEAAIGASIAGVRSLASMKHVGVNVAADPLFTFGYTGVGGGLVLVSADEPGMHSSQNEQDNRNYASSAKWALLEPSNSQECRDMTKAAYEISEQFGVPVLLRTTTRVCHSKSIVTCSEREEFQPIAYQKNAQKHVTVPANARALRVQLAKRMQALKAYSETCSFNYIVEGGNIGVVTSGICYHYAREVFGDRATYLKLGFTNPLPDNLLKQFAQKVDIIYVLEENDPYLEHWVKSMGIACKGKEIFPAFGELTPDVLRHALGQGELPVMEYSRDKIVARPPTLCAGCPHRGFFYELGKKKNVVVSGDIGCYTLGFAPPYNAMDTAICMGGAFSVGHGMQKAFDLSGQNKRVVGVMGDSTFFHTGINSLIEVLYNNSKTICVILDNRITGMTGHQENPGSGKQASGKPAPEMDIATIVKALGAKHVMEVNPNDLKAVRKALDDALALEEASVIITKWPCVLKKMDTAERSAWGNPFTTKYLVNEDLCIGCKACIRSGCPAISMKENKKSSIDAPQCVGCSVCAQICPKQAIGKAPKKEEAGI
jgi:indolepyruvate ferredoxin oxidoreductase alpha subunit